MKEKSTLIRNVCVILGIIIFLGMIAFSLYHTNNMWNSLTKSETFNSFAEYFFSRAKGEILLAFVAGFIPVSVGIFVRHRCK